MGSPGEAYEGHRRDIYDTIAVNLGASTSATPPALQRLGRSLAELGWKHKRKLAGGVFGYATGAAQWVWDQAAGIYRRKDPTKPLLPSGKKTRRRLDLTTKADRNTMGRIRGGKRRRAFARVRRRPVGVHVPGSKLLKFKFNGCMKLSINTTNTELLTPAPGPAASATTTKGVPCNSLFQPGRFMYNVAATPAVDTQHDATGVNLAQMMWKRYKVVKAVFTAECIRPIGNSGVLPMMCGINITEPQANEQLQSGSVALGKRGTDLTTVNIDRESYRLKKNMLGAGKTNIMNDSNAFRHKMSATWYASKWNRGHHYDPEGQWARTANAATDIAPGQITALNNVSPGDPEKLVFFQPWCCDPTRKDNAAANALDFQWNVTYYVACKERRQYTGFEQ